MTIPVPEYTGCLWPLDPGCLGEDWAEYDQSVQDRAAALASETLHRLTGHRVGGCPVTVRPFVTNNGCLSFSLIDRGLAFYPNLDVQGNWVNTTTVSRCEVALPRPVGRVDEVKVDGDVLTAGDYRIDDGHLLTWQGTGDCPWTAALLQDPTRPDSEAGTFSVTFLNAYEVDSNGAYAAGVLAAEFAKACVGSKACRLPRGVQSIARDGVVVEIASGAFPGGLTGIREVDAFIMLWNPAGLSRGSTVWSPDVDKYRVQGG